MRSYRHAILALFLLAAVTLHGCGEDKKEESIVEKIEDVKEEVQETVQETVDKVTETVKESIKQVEESIKKETPGIIASFTSSIKETVTPSSVKPAPAAEQKPASKPQGNPFDQLNGTPLEQKKDALFKMLTTLDETLDNKIPEPVKKILMIVFPFIATAQALCNKLFPKPVDHMTVKERLVLKLAVLVVVPQLISVIVGFAEYKFTFGINKHPIKFSTWGSCTGSDSYMPEVCKDISDRSDIVAPWVIDTVTAKDHEGNVVEVEVYMLTPSASTRTSSESSSYDETTHEDVFGNKCCTGPQCFVDVFDNQETKTGYTSKKLVVSQNKCILTQCMASPLHTVSSNYSSDRQEMRDNSDVASIFPGCSSYKTQVNAVHAVGTVVKSLVWTLTLLVSAVSNLALIFFAIKRKVGQVLVFIPFVAISVGLGVVSLLASGFSILRPTGTELRNNYVSGSHDHSTGNDQFNTDVIFGTRNQSSFWEVRRAAAYTSVYVYCFYAVAFLNVVLSTPDMVILGATLAKKK